jgi:hypothetical protein
MTRLLLASVLVASLASVAIACSGSDDSLDGAPEPPSTAAPGTEPPPQDGGELDSGVAPGDGATTADSALPDAAKPKNAFEGAPAYAPQAGPSTRQAGHSFNGNTPKTNPAGKPCLNCHGAGGGAPTFAAGGTVYDGAKVAANVEVRVVDATTGKAYSAFTNADGNYFFPAASLPATFPALVGVRNAAGTRLMASPAPKGNCNECHSIAGGAGRIVVTP